jgi:hypothetical protein
MEYDPMIMDDAEALGPVVKISQVRPSLDVCSIRRQHSCLSRGSESVA